MPSLALGSPVCFGKGAQERLQLALSSLSPHLGPGKEEFGRGVDRVINTPLPITA